jgi:glycosyltransferase involved in cell wall biosynthesis
VSVATKAGLQLDKNILIEKINQAKFAEYLNASDVLLMNYPKTEHYEKYMSPTKLFAYMATGKPIISSNIETVRLMSTEYNALFADSNSIEDYSQLMTYVIENMESMIEGEVQRKKIVEKYSWYKRALNVIK